jgi:hypothetical protein
MWKDLRKIRFWVIDQLRKLVRYPECSADIGREAAVLDPTARAGKISSLAEVWKIDHVSYDFLAEIVSVEDKESQRKPV